jgi:hypothetical protein
VNSVTSRLGYFADTVLNPSDGLLSDPFAGQLIVTGHSANSLFNLTDEPIACPRDALFGAPEGGAACCVLDVAITGPILRARLIEHNIHSDANANTRHHPCKSFH